MKRDTFLMSMSATGCATGLGIDAKGQTDNSRTSMEGKKVECKMDHIVLNVHDVRKMTEFYTNVLMLKPERVEAYRAGKTPFPSVRMNADTIIDLFPKEMWQTSASAKKGMTNLNHFCLSLTKNDWEALLENLKANEVEIEEGPVLRWGAHETGTAIYFSDPENNVIEARPYAAS